MLSTDDNPEGLPIDVFDQIRAGEAANRSQLYRDLADGPFFGHNRNRTSPRDSGTRSGCRAWPAATGRRTSASPRSRRPTSAPTWPRSTCPTLVIHGDDDQIVPFEVGGQRSAQLVDGAVLKVYEGGAHALPDTERDRLHADLLEFIDA